jgi:hypothetical protein
MPLHHNAVHVRPDQASLQGIPELLREVTTLAIYRHPNIVPLLSYSLSRSDDGRQEACLVCHPAPRIRPAFDQRLTSV